MRYARNIFLAISLIFFAACAATGRPVCGRSCVQDKKYNCPVCLRVFDGSANKCPYDSAELVK